MYICLFKQLIVYYEKSTNLPVRQHLKFRRILRRIPFKDSAHMKNLKTADLARTLLGLLLVFVGSNKVFQFMPMPEMPLAASTFMGAIVSAGFLLPLMALLEVLSGALLIMNKYSLLSAIIILPITLTAMIFHLALDPSNILFAGIAFSLNVIVLFNQKKKISTLVFN